MFPNRLQLVFHFSEHVTKADSATFTAEKYKKLTKAKFVKISTLGDNLISWNIFFTFFLLLLAHFLYYLQHFLLSNFRSHSYLQYKLFTFCDFALIQTHNISRYLVTSAEKTFRQLLSELLATCF